MNLSIESIFNNHLVAFLPGVGTASAAQDDSVTEPAGVGAADFTKFIAPIEIMIQEGVADFALPVELCSMLGGLRQVFASRANFGVYGATFNDLDVLLEISPDFVSLQFPDLSMIDQLHQHQIGVLASGLTPNEVSQLWDFGVDAVLVAPSDALGGSYPASLLKLVPGVAVGPMFGVSNFSAAKWLQAGAKFVVLDVDYLREAAPGGNFSRLRDDTAAMVKAVSEACRGN